MINVFCDTCKVIMHMHEIHRSVGLYWFLLDLLVSIGPIGLYWSHRVILVLLVLLVYIVPFFSSGPSGFYRSHWVILVLLVLFISIGLYRSCWFLLVQLALFDSNRDFIWFQFDQLAPLDFNGISFGPIGPIIL